MADLGGELATLAQAQLTVHSCVGFYLERYVSKVHRSLPVEELVNVIERRRRRLSSRLPPLAIKVAAHGAVLSPLERRTFGAAARFHLRTGLPIVTHSPRGV